MPLMLPPMTMARWRDMTEPPVCRERGDFATDRRAILNFVKRWSILFVALLVGAAAPARAWCEATCLATAHQESAKPHCPSHEPSSNSPTMAAAKGADCPALESARP